MAKRRRDKSPASSLHLPDVADDGNRVLNKYTQIDGNDGAATGGLMRCFLPPHRPVSFSTYDEYDSHYQQTHVHRCLQCRKNFPSPHFVTLHIAENHDPLNEAKKARGDKIYACFVEDCDKVCSAPQKRRMHLVDKHHFPKNYNFFIVNDGLDRRNSMLRPNAQRRRRTSLLGSVHQAHSSSSATNSRASDHSQNTDAPQVDRDGSADVDPEESENEEHVPLSEPQHDEEGFIPDSKSVEDGVDAITNSMSALKFVPPSVRFGRGRVRGFARR